LEGCPHTSDDCSDGADCKAQHDGFVLRISETPTFAAYSAGELVATWTGGDAEMFVRTIEKTLPSAAGKFKQAVLAAGCN